MDESEPFVDDGGVESTEDKEGELFYAGEDEVLVLDVNEQEYRDIFGVDVSRKLEIHVSVRLLTMKISQ